MITAEVPSGSLESIWEAGLDIDSPRADLWAQLRSWPLNWMAVLDLDIVRAVPLGRRAVDRLEGGSGVHDQLLMLQMVTATGGLSGIWTVAGGLDDFLFQEAILGDRSGTNPAPEEMGRSGTTTGLLGARHVGHRLRSEAFDRDLPVILVEGIQEYLSVSALAGRTGHLVFGIPEGLECYSLETFFGLGRGIVLHACSDELGDRVVEGVKGLLGGARPVDVVRYADRKSWLYSVRPIKAGRDLQPSCADGPAGATTLSVQENPPRRGGGDRAVPCYGPAALRGAR